MYKLHRILVTTGITGGHFFPAVRFAEKYLERHPDAEVTFVLGRTVSTVVASKYLKSFQVRSIPVDPLPPPFSFKVFPFLVKYPLSIFRTWRFVRDLKPRVLVSFGSYGSFPAVLASKFSGIPVVVHEQNKIAGWANQASAMFARFVAVSFPDTLGRLPKQKVRYIGYPVRKEIRTGGKQGKQILSGNKHRILVLGGSQGSKKLNQVVTDFFSILTPEEKKRIAVIHIAGEKESEAVRERYKTLGVESEVVAFSENMADCFGRSTLVIARAGAGTIFELAVFGLPSILVPYPYAYAHQSLNAKSLTDLNAAVTIDEEKLDAERLKTEVMKLINDKNLYQTLAVNVRQFDLYDSEDQLVNLVDEAARAENQPGGSS